MRQSIKKIFTNLNIYMIIVLLISMLSALLVLEHGLSFDKVNNLNKQKEIILALTKLDKRNITFSKIEFNSKSRKLLADTEFLRNNFNYNFTGKMFLDIKKEYMHDLDKLQSHINSFNKVAAVYYSEDMTLQEEKLQNLVQSQEELTAYINSIILKNITYDEKKYYFIRNLSILSMLFILLGTFWYRSRIQSIYNDIRFLFTIEKDKNKQSYQVFSEEVDAISLRMRRKSVTLDNPEMLDPVTDIYNYKGLVAAYNNNKKSTNESNHIAVAILEIDSFSKSNRAFAQETTQAMLKKTAFTISLHEQPIDIVARTDYNQFTIILSRINKKQLFSDLDVMRQSIEEIKFHTPNGNVNITISGGFMVKTTKITLEDAIKKAKEVLEHAKARGGNRISQTQDLIVFEDTNTTIA